MKKGIIFILILITVIVVGILLNSGVGSSRYLVMEESEINNYLTKNYSSYELLESYLTEDKLLYYVLLLGENKEGVVLQLSKRENGFTTKTSSMSFTEPISLLELNTDSISKIQVGIIYDKSIEEVKLTFDDNKQQNYILNGKKGFIITSEESIRKVELFDKEHNLISTKEI